MKKIIISSLIIFTFLLSISCGDNGNNNKKIVAGKKGNSLKKTEEFKGSGPMSVKKYDTPAGADPKISAEDGGDGFEKIAASLGYETNTDIFQYGDSKATKGGRFTMAYSEYPPTFRTQGKDANRDVISTLEALVYEGLLDLDGQTLKYMPKLATHWKISEDKMTFWLRMNPKARWSDGKPVTSDDVIATLKLMTDEGILAPYTNQLYSKYSPEKISKYLLKVTVKEVNWRLFLYFSASMTIFPAHHLNKIDGTGYLSKYQFKMLPGTGPYILDEKNTVKGSHVMIRRRSDWWGANLKDNIGSYNFDEIKLVVVRDRVLIKEKFKKGDLDFFSVLKPIVWVKEFDINNTQPPFEALEKGLVQKMKVFNYMPQGISGLVFNMRKPPFNDIKIRKAFAYLWNKKQLIEKLFYNEFELLTSNYPNSIYQNHENPVFSYNPEKGNKLLDEAGWSKKNSEGYRINDKDEIFELEMPIIQRFEQRFTPYQEELRKAGIKLDLKIVDNNTSFQIGLERRFQIMYTGWTGLFFPNPESSVHSSTADPDNTTNFPGIKDKRIDEICDKYNSMFDQNERIEGIKTIDKILAETVHYAYAWYTPYAERCMYWNKFGMPEHVFGYMGDWKSTMRYWWVDKDKLQKLESAKNDDTKKLQINEVNVDYWNVRKK